MICRPYLEENDANKLCVNMCYKWTNTSVVIVMWINICDCYITVVSLKVAGHNNHVNIT